MKLERLIPALAPSHVVGRPSVEIRDLAYDARRVAPGALFFCVPGARTDGHEFAGEAVGRGAVGLVVERPLELPVPQLVVADARAAMALTADVFFGQPTRELTVAGVTGTNGKTTTAYLLQSVLAAAGLRPGLVTTIETIVGDERRPAVRTTPEAIDLQRTFRAMLDRGDRSCAMEATSHGSELKRLLGVRFAVLVFTNLTRDHLDFHGTMERYFQAKRQLFAERPPAAVNIGDPYGRRLADELHGQADLLTFGLVPDADVRADGVELTGDGARFRTAGIDIRTRLRGEFNVLNVLAAIAACRLLRLPNEAIAAGVAALPGVPGRFEPVDEGQPFTVLVDYAHKPDALRSALLASRSLSRNRLLCIFGCGGDRDREKRAEMGRIASTLADVSIVTSDNPRGEDALAIIDDALAGAAGDVEVEPDRRAAIARGLALAEPGDVLLIAGKGHEQGQEFRGETVPFDDREVVRELLRERRVSRDKVA
ncbi:MAG: UDP-N-acetylmuramoyl-L-alanyl-D-glutamate--2,6-diaminopimelate ligase [Actinomycetota bacterium]|nr:UDP-N-acetylmuramoyl-L-alanyl-D-glutamate--2,6-diaminopimelate ligase [Actinomycetota bacterium]